MLAIDQNVAFQHALAGAAPCVRPGAAASASLVSAFDGEHRVRRESGRDFKDFGSVFWDGLTSSLRQPLN